MAKELRVAGNVVEIVGMVKEHNLKEGKGESGKYINGNIVVKTGEYSEQKVKVFVSEKNKEGKVKKAYETLSKFISEEYKTLVNCGENKATEVSLWSSNKDFAPQLKEEIFAVEGNARTSISIDLGFGNITVKTDITEEDYKAEFDIEMYVSEVVEEIKNDEETGRAIVRGYVPCYGGLVFPIELVAGMIDGYEEGEVINFAESLLDAGIEGQTLNIWGSINHSRIVEKIKKGEGKLGRVKIEEKITYVHEFVAEGGEEIEDEDKEFDEDLIRKALKEREIKIKEVEENAEKGENKKGKGLGLKKSFSEGTEKRRPKF